MITVNFPDGKLLLVLDPDSRDMLMKGEVVNIPELNLAIGYVKDPVFVEREMEKANYRFTYSQIGQVLAEGYRREEVWRGRECQNKSVGITGI